MRSNIQTQAVLMSGVAAAVLLFGAAAASAQTAPDGTTGVTAYPASAFAASAPASAREMLDRTPGFALVEPDADVRGYSGAQGNVLIDGVRPASKRENVSDLLRRIPAGTVERIELIRGGAGGVDMGGYAVLANVVRRHVVDAEGMVEIGALSSTDGWFSPSGQAQYTRRWGARSLELSAKLEPDFDDDSGDGPIWTETPGGAVTERFHEDTRKVQHAAEVAANWTQPLAGGRFNVTAAVRGDRARADTVIQSLDDADDREDVAAREEFIEGELGARYQRSLGTATTLEALASQRLGRLSGDEKSQQGADSESFDETTRTGESIARIDLTHRRSDQLSLSAGLEGAFNFLESEARLQENGAPVFLPGSDVRIEERRIEGSLGATWTPVEAVIVEAGLRVEGSTITQTGDSPLERDFTYAKPRLALTWDMDAQNQLRLAVSREVGQLDFGEFVASASLSTGVVAVGNAALEPDKSWRFSAAWERSFWDDASLTLTWTHDQISDVVDRVLIVTDDAVFDAPGNIGDGRRDTLAIDLNTPLDRLGIRGGQLRASMLWRTSRVTDPVTGEARDISEEKPVEGEVAFTQAMPQWRMNWGVTVEHIAERKTRYRFDDVRRRSEDLGWTIFAERRMGDRWRLRAEATDLFGRDFHETRDKYDGPRATGALEEIERRERRSPGYVSLTLRRSMGG
ncbi:MAG: TonB-dependent receptor [Candidatus Brevundimonas phytovorans]|nr:TonB-dependent receptor [Brevundimonas sp.]WEK58589.1 MAG: TonB-dependent receptor [Brevundimonas sp.]